jgi:hypothetical protein
MRGIISTQHKRRKCSPTLLYRTGLIAINPSECYVITNFLEGDLNEAARAADATRA